jgi:hypothetical protein
MIKLTALLSIVPEKIFISILNENIPMNFSHKKITN